MNYTTPRELTKNNSNFRKELSDLYKKYDYLLIWEGVDQYTLIDTEEKMKVSNYV